MKNTIPSLESLLQHKFLWLDIYIDSSIHTLNLITNEKSKFNSRKEKLNVQMHHASIRDV
uniref:Uncharacterized protein n=1 Tax=Arundo donax TaxID=35708 RepID=A0A0A9C9R4_ARUDO